MTGKATPETFLPCPLKVVLIRGINDVYDIRSAF